MQNEKLRCKLYLLFVWARILLDFRDLTSFYIKGLLEPSRVTLIFMKATGLAFFQRGVSWIAYFYGVDVKFENLCGAGKIIFVASKISSASVAFSC
jgi:hypothetical protein